MNFDASMKEAENNLAPKIQVEILKLRRFESAYFKCKRYFENNGMQNYLLAQSVFTKDFKTSSAKSNQIIARKSNGLS